MDNSPKNNGDKKANDKKDRNKAFNRLNMTRGDQVMDGKPTMVQDTEQLSSFIESLESEMQGAVQVSDKLVLPPDASINGQRYSNLFERWEQWLFSSSPYNVEGSEILFLRGNMDNFKDVSSFLDMTFLSGNSQRIYYGKWIFVPAITAGFNIGDYFGGEKIRDEESLHRAVQDYIFNGGPRWASLETLNDQKVFTLPLYYVETPLFQLHVAEDNPWRKYVDPVQEAGDYFSVCGGYVVILRELLQGKYRIRFGGIGRRNYRTDAVWDVEVVGTSDEVKKLSPGPDDQSKYISKQRHPSQVLLSKYVSPGKAL